MLPLPPAAEPTERRLRAANLWNGGGPSPSLRPSVFGEIILSCGLPASHALRSWIVAPPRPAAASSPSQSVSRRWSCRLLAVAAAAAAALTFCPSLFAPSSLCCVTWLVVDVARLLALCTRLNLGVGAVSGQETAMRRRRRNGLPCLV